jgi:inner membrane protein
MGVALFAPFSDQRIFFSCRPIEVSPLSITRFMSLRGARVLKSELLWVISPALGLAILGSLINFFLRHKKTIPQLSLTPRS